PDPTRACRMVASGLTATNNREQERVMARVAIGNGGTGGIGEAISIALKNMGMDVAANYAGNDERAREFSDRTGIRAFRWDVADFEACQQGVAQVEAELGPVDVLVNNAGISRVAA